jgi:hypothetical protein
MIIRKSKPGKRLARRIPTFQIPTSAFNQIRAAVETLPPADARTGRIFLEHLQPIGKK